MSFHWRILVILLTAATVFLLTLSYIPTTNNPQQTLYISEKALPAFSNQTRSYRLQKVVLLNDQVKFYKRQKDVYHQRIEDKITPINDRLNRLVAKDWNAKQRKKFSFFPLDSRKQYLVYSAHYDAIQSIVKFVGFGPMTDNSLHSLTCSVAGDSGQVEQSPMYIYYRISTFHPWTNQIYDSYIYACNSTLKAPANVAITSGANVNIHVKLPISESNADREKVTPNYQFAVCVEPLVNGYNDVDSIKHFIAVNSMLGAEHFYFYVSYASIEVERFLASTPMVTIYQWRLGDAFDKTHAFGQKASNAHCLYRHRRHVRYLIYIDIDEVLVPLVDSSWSQMVNRLLQTSDQGKQALLYQWQVSDVIPKLYLNFFEVYKIVKN